MGNLLVNIKQNEATEEKTENNKKIIQNIILNDGMKDKQISGKVNEKSWEMFTRINKAQGLTNNGALNMIINKYVRENKGIIEE